MMTEIEKRFNAVERNIMHKLQVYCTVHVTNRAVEGRRYHY